MTACLAGNLRQSERIASTTMILNSSVMSAMKDEICFMRRSTDASLPVCTESAAAPSVNRDPDLEQSSDGICRDAAVGIGDEILHVEVARRYSLRVSHGEFAESLDRRELQDGFGRGEEELQDYSVSL